MTTQRPLLLTIGLMLALTAVAIPMEAAEQGGKIDKYWVFIGTQSGKGGGKGIYRAEFDAATGKLFNVELAAETPSPTFLAIHPNQKFLYSVSEGGTADAKASGLINAFALDAKTGKLTFLNNQKSGGPGPAHVSVDREGKCVLAANYGGGSICCLPIQKDGSLAPASTFIQHEGKSVNPTRQTKPYAHSINVDAANRFAFAADLGIDKVLIYKFDATKGTLIPNDPPAVEVAKGAGPRHFAFHPSGKFAYVINELDSTVTAMSYDAAKGALKPLQTLSTLPMDTKGNSTAEVVVHPTGKFLYGSNRGHNSIAIFTINEKTGELTAAGYQDKDIKTPRNFALDPSGTLMIVANQDSSSLVVFRVDQKTGALEPTGIKVEVPRPVCVRFVAKTTAVAPNAPEANRRAPDLFHTRLETSKGDVMIEVHRDWSPHGVDRFYSLVTSGYYDDTRFFRMSKQWVQFGINGNPTIAKAWRRQTIPDDPRRESNVRGTIAFAFAVPNGRTTQLFINLKDNAATHDSEPFVPFGRVVEGMKAVDALNAEYGESAGGGIRGGKQGPLFEEGNTYLDREFPRLDRIVRATIVKR